jgi:hypothetical protein
VRTLIAELLDETDLQRGMSLCWQGEQVGIVDNIPFFAKQQMGQPLWEVFRPMFELDAVRGARNVQAYATALRQPNYPECVKASPPPPNLDYPTIMLSTRVMSRYLATTPSTSLLRRHWTIVAERRMAAISLALRLYALDHNGRLPATLDELVPRYMAPVPNDPFTQASPFIYRPSGDNPILYSVGVNGADDGGKFQTKLNPQPDVGISLKPRPHVTTAPATEPSE